MDVTVILPGALRAESDGEARIAVPVDAGGVPLRRVLDELARRHPRLDRRLRDERGRLRRYVNVYVGAEECRSLEGLETPVAAGTEVWVLPSVAGG
ncbi:MoaD/ThiS family protein [Marinitenerispora sediminis]|uniref:Molybdopterin synthase sulfur carrier subunit n=1 Tax=Marinitenerispora sediminis TaxID=1931232 RepID=A0A368T4A5_9ACTN|nr:MoaD/ThiS family protein [Marinitenerispora sediminis]RCV50295.1 molybdopterin synthase sulfur carrier subunit [Marinitenerispora sediminis]RCV53770.1 molybdopterin synthase sulfur carrier subunit [Marinitenerispora sediminis]RCV58059.1 molybdopterin synthase sulfur carrier subunit [Marinitenerispora sediminis]